MSIAVESDLCPETGERDCTRCSGEFCEQHGTQPCDCDTAERHGKRRKPVTVFFTMVHSPTGLQRAGRPYRTRKAAREWVPFVRGAWHGMRVTVEPCLITFDADGKPDKATRERLDKEFNMDVPK